MARLNAYGNTKYRNRYVPAADIAASGTWSVPITDTQRDEYAPFTICRIHNRTASPISVSFNASNLGDDTIQASNITSNLPPGMTLEKKNEFLFDRIAIKNLNPNDTIDIATGATETIVVEIANYGE